MLLYHYDNYNSSAISVRIDGEENGRVSEIFSIFNKYISNQRQTMYYPINYAGIWVKQWEKAKGRYTK